MKKLTTLLFIACCAAFLSCGGEQKEHPIRYGSEWSEINGNPRSMVCTDIDYEGIPADRPGDTMSVTVTYYNDKSDIVAYEYYNYTDPDEDYSSTYEYDEKDRLVRVVLNDHSDEDGSYWTDYTWKGGMIVKREDSDENGMFRFTKYEYDGNKEVSRSSYNSIAIRTHQMDTTWDGDKVVKVVEKSDGSEIVRTIEYPDENTEKIAVNGFGPEDEGLSYEITVTFDEHGNFRTYASRSEEYESEYRYSYEYDSNGNWTRRTVTDEEGEVTRIETREFTY